MSSPIDLRKLQNEAAHYFKEWDDAATSDKADEARQKIVKLAYDEISRLNESRKTIGGLYLFTNCCSECGKSGVVYYVGLAKAQTLAKRMSDYLVKELSVLDPSLLRLEEITASNKISNRISKAMPRTGSDKIQKYVKKHMKSRLMSRADKIYLFPNSASPSHIEDAETILIAAAIANKQKLVNIKKTFAKPAFIGNNLAFEAVNKWKSDGLGDDVCCALFAEIGRLGSSQED